MQAIEGLRGLSDVEFDQQARFSFVLQMTDPTQGPSPTEVLRLAAAATAEPEPEGAAVTVTADDDERDYSSEEEWDAFQAPPLPESDQVVPPGMTAGGLARRRASLAPQVRTPLRAPAGCCLVGTAAGCLAKSAVYSAVLLKHENCSRHSLPSRRSTTSSTARCSQSARRRAMGWPRTTAGGCLVLPWRMT
jgi:hypothetical protein